MSFNKCSCEIYGKTREHKDRPKQIGFDNAYSCILKYGFTQTICAGNMMFRAPSDCNEKERNIGQCVRL